MSTLDLLSVLADESVRAAGISADRLETHLVFGDDTTLDDPDGMLFSATSVEVAAERMSRAGDSESTGACKEAFELLRGVVRGAESEDVDTSVDDLRLVTRASCLGVLGDSPSQTRQLLQSLDSVALADGNWGKRVEASTLLAWLYIIRKQGWDDLDASSWLIGQLRADQAESEPPFLADSDDQSDAWRLVASYHLLRAAEIVGEFTTTGTVGGQFDPIEQSEMHFDRAREAADYAADSELGFISSLLELASGWLVASSIWGAARGAGTRAQRFVEQLASRARPLPFFELLPPQRRALLDAGLIGTGRRSVVVSLPTSAGKTLVAEFRILQALDRYEAQGGWVAYTAPTRALVNQLTSRLRRDFEPLGIRVEKFSPALEVDSVEAELLEEDDRDPFRVIVTTPEKLDLLLRGGWTDEISRPLSLVIVDEAHNLGTGARGLRLELLLATINREFRDASFMLLTPFVPNAAEIARWLDPTNSESVELALEWMPNDRVVGLAIREPGDARGDSVVLAKTVVASKPSLQSEDAIVLDKGRPLGLTHSELRSPGRLAAATSKALERRGSTVTLVQQPRHSWSIAASLATEDLGYSDDAANSSYVDAVQAVLRREYGSDYPLVDLLGRRTAVHHAGLSDDVRSMLEALAERGALDHIVATTTLAQGINFPVCNVVLASHQYPYGVNMPPEDFWNIAGRAGRADHGQAGVVLLSAPETAREELLTVYLKDASTNLTSTLVEMVKGAVERFGSLDLSRLSVFGDWSAFDQFITHTLRIAGPENFGSQVEQVLRGTLGFRTLRSESPELADALVRSVQRYTSALAGRPISLVDSTGFSWESVNGALARMADVGLGNAPWGSEIFDAGSSTLKDAIGVLLQVPELRDQLVERLDGNEARGDFLSRVVKDWVSGKSLSDIAGEYFATAEDGQQRDTTVAMTRCCQRLFSSILPTISWGLSALQALNLRGHEGEIDPSLRDVPSFVFYGVGSREAVALRLFGVPRGAAPSLAETLARGESASSNELRSRLGASSVDDWTQSLGDVGAAYFQAWRLVESAA